MKPSIMIVDDEELIRDYLKTVLKTFGYNTIYEVDSDQNITNMIIEKKPDILLLDINLPEKTGIEILNELNEIVSDICIIMLTGVTCPTNIKTCIDLGANHFIRKDTPIMTIIKIISATWESFQKKYNNVSYINE